MGSSAVELFHSGATQSAVAVVSGGALVLADLTIARRPLSRQPG